MFAKLAYNLAMVDFKLPANIWWLSFSLENVNVGVCLIRADTKEAALERAASIGAPVHKENVHVLAILSTTDQIVGEKIEVDRFYTKQEMAKIGYGTVDTCKDCTDIDAREIQ